MNQSEWVLQKRVSDSRLRHLMSMSRDVNKDNMQKLLDFYKLFKTEKPKHFHINMELDELPIFFGYTTFERRINTHRNFFFTGVRFCLRI